MDSLLKDIRYGFRGLLLRPAFTIVALVILALGIGANTAIFTLINAVVLKPLPVSKPEELVLFNDSPSEGTRVSDGDIASGRWDHFSYAAYRYFREQNRSFQELSAFRSGESRVSVRRPAPNRESLRSGRQATLFPAITLRFWASRQCEEGCLQMRTTRLG